ncbi:hypothetical protein Spea_1261 [Shewanella pealeana ATCC 700345]|uniref:Uncharacterized protein n=1 Tax=Shewanella pealeana (strain ATCC 700345 / ANG-SQ1) TaxID=398579 RepID=A8H201_SHEPA|nr:hypothetical protein Spea_1261 [Shewanella pealeana ATCC 700345]
MSASTANKLVSEIVNGVASSPQVKSAVLGGIGCTMQAKAADSKHTLWLALVGVIAGCVIVNAQRDYDFVLTP